MVEESRQYRTTEVLPAPTSRTINLQRLALPLAPRIVAHCLILFLAVSVVLSGTISAQDKGRVGESATWQSSPFEGLSTFSPSEYLQKPPQPVAAGPARSSSTSTRDEAITYEVVSGDTIYDIADTYGVSIQSIIWSNSLEDADSLGIGDKLVIPPVSGVLHTIQSGDTLAGIAGKYKVDAANIIGYASNKLVEPYTLSVGQKLMVPGGQVQETLRPAPVARSSDRVTSASSPAKRSSSGFAWPTYGPIFTYFSSWHAGLDISPSYGTPVYAAADGVVLETTKLSWSYGWYIIMDNGAGYTTMYAHLSRFAVSPGESVSKGELIGYVGSTGRSTGPHLHFEIRVNGSAVDPLRYLP